MPSNASLQARRLEATPRGVSIATEVFIDRAQNAEIWDVDGNRYIDFAGGIAVLNTGHRHPRVMKAVTDQLARFTHAAFQVTLPAAALSPPKARSGRESLMAFRLVAKNTCCT